MTEPLKGLEEIMLERFTLVVAGVPVPKGRPRMTRSGHVFTPKKTKSYEDDLRILARDRMRGAEPFSGPLTVEIHAYLPAPTSWPKWKAENLRGNRVSHTSRPDIDNLGKIIDGLNGVVWADDSQITDLHIYKRYSYKPRLVVDVTHDPGAIHSRTKTRPTEK